MKESGINMRRSAMFFLLLLVAGVFYVYNVWTPLMSDDLWVPFYIDENMKFTTQRISSVSDWAWSWYRHWCAHMNGRLADYVASPVLLLGGKTLFNVLNTGVFLLVCMCVSYFCFRKINVICYCLVLASLLLFLPDVTGCLLWVCGSVNYLWGALLLLVVLLTLKSIQDARSINLAWKAIGVVCAFLCGAWHEALGVTLCAALGMYGVVQFLQQRRVSGLYVLLLLAVLFGTAITISSPAMWVRFGVSSGGGDLMSIVHRCASNCVGVISCSFILLVAFVLLAKRNPKSLLSPLGGLIIANFGLVLIAGGSGGRPFFYLNFALILYTLSETKDIVKSFPRVVAVVTSSICVLMAATAAPAAYAIYELHQNVLQNARPNSHMTVDVSCLGNALPFQMNMSLPRIEGYERLRQSFCAWYGVPSFTVYLRNCSLSSESYAIFDADDPHRSVIRSVGDKYVVRLARGMHPKAHEVSRASFEQDGKKQVWITPTSYPWRWYHCLHSYYSGVKLQCMETDYHEGFHYLVIPAVSHCCDTLVVALNKGEISIPLHKD